ncbi:uncharacterized protein K02A2.6-like [Dioscorea cayenensis subsp. rotundata]|uniref:Uncharacterized protein K02A2.6-like n=1 Tax=Dioscorea cayennensis subsp. rotundata TaxID=55577 RepID=A0AB40BRV8_DIOCR|nr:uncharacterized protein K02A2.6-like [Dioscorea cayenensis subsp. rotundata]
MAAQRERGLCYNCDAKFTKGHRCNPPQFLCIMIQDEDSDDILYDHQEPPEVTVETEPPDTELELDNTPCISYHALNGFLVPSTLKIAGKIFGKPVVVLIDSGSTNNFIQTRWAHHLSLPVQPSSHLKVTVGNGETLTCGGECLQVPLQLGDTVFQVDLLLLSVFGADIVLGIHWLPQLGQIVFDYNELWMEFTCDGVRTRLQGIKQTNLHDSTNSSLRRQLHTNTVSQFLHISISLDETPPKHHSLTPVIVDATAPQLFADQLHDLLSRYEDIFSVPIGLPPVREFDHRIPLLPSAAPVNVRPYRYPHSQKAEIERLVGDMLTEGIIRPSSSPFSSPVILVKKKDGSWRFCVDYRALNTITVKDRFPIPTVEELLDELANAQVFSKLDLRSGYHQVRIHPSDIEKSAFRTHEGHYEFLVMPFGLSNAPSTFQALMQSIFRPAIRRFALVFFDDILIYSTSWESHLEHLQLIFSLFRAHKLFAKRTKCAFGCSSINYLGHKISGRGVES